MHTFKTILLGSSVLVLETDISQYSVYSHSLWYIKTQLLEETCYSLFIFILFYWIISFGVHEQSMQDSCVGTHMAVCFHFFSPSPTFGFSPQAIPPHLPLPLALLFPPNRPRCLVLPFLCPCVLIFQHPPMSENMWCFIFCSSFSLLRMMFSRFIHLPTNDTNSSFLIAA